MKWISNKIIIGSGIFLSVFFSVFLFSSSYAISDVVYTIDETNYTSTFSFCGGSTGINCSDYQYLIIDSTSLSNTTQFNFSIRNGLLITPYDYTQVILKITSDVYEPKWRYDRNNSSSVASSFTSSHLVFTVTLTDSLPSAPCPEPEEPEPCPECEVCPVIPDNPYDDKFDAIVRAIYVGCATLLVLYFFYCIYRIIIRNSGVN